MWIFYGPLQKKNIRTIGYKEDSEEKTRFIWFQLFKKVVINLEEYSFSWRDFINQLRRRCLGNEQQLHHIHYFERVRGNIGNVIALNSFLSCSKSRKVPEIFADIDGVQNMNEMPIIYEVEVDPMIVMANISEESQFPVE